MTFRLLTAASVAALVCSALGAHAEVPARIDDPGGGPPVWMTADAAKSADGSMLWEEFSPSMRADLQQRIEMNRQLRSERTGAVATAPGTCQTVRRPTSGLPLPDTSFASFLDYSQFAFEGTVRSIAEGFYHGQLATLVEVEVERVLEEPATLGPVSTVYVRFGHAEVEAGGEMLCVRNEHYPDRPSIGRHILVFAETVAEHDPLIVNPHSLAVLFEREDGSVSLGWERGSFVDEGPTWSAVDRQLDLLGTEPRPPDGAEPKGER